MPVASVATTAATNSNAFAVIAATVITAAPIVSAISVFIRLSFVCVHCVIAVIGL